MVIPVDSSSQKVKNSRKLAPLLLIWDCQLWAIFQRVKLTIFITSQNWHWQSRNNIYWCKCPLYYTMYNIHTMSQRKRLKRWRGGFRERRWRREQGAEVLRSSSPRFSYLLALCSSSRRNWCRLWFLKSFFASQRRRCHPCQASISWGEIIGKMEVQFFFFSLSVKPGLVFHSSEKELEELEAEVELPNWVRSAKVSGLS